MKFSSIPPGSGVDGRFTVPAEETAAGDGTGLREKTVNRIRSVFYADFNPLMERAMRAQQMAEGRMLRNCPRGD